MKCDAAYRDEIVDKCTQALSANGFTRFRKGDVDKSLTDGFRCWVGLNTGLYSSRVEINPFVGLHVVPLMKFYTKMKGRKYDRGVATYAVHMGELVPNVTAFEFTRETDVEAEAERLAKLYATVGVAFAETIANYDDLLPLLRSRIDMLGAYPERVASCLYLMGRKAEARTFTEEFLVGHRDYFEGFAVPFLEMLEHGAAGS